MSAPEIENKTLTLEIDENLQAKVQTLIDEGWQLAPGFKPVAVYQLIRLKPAEPPPHGALGIMQIDDSKIIVIPAAAKAN